MNKKEFIAFWYNYVLTLSRSISFMIMGLICIYVVGQASNYTWKTGIMVFIPFMFVSIHYLILPITELKKECDDES